MGTRNAGNSPICGWVNRSTSLARGGVLAREYFIDCADRTLRHARCIERGAELVAGAPGDGGSEPRHDVVASPQPAAVAQQLSLAPPGLQPEGAAERKPVLVARGDVQIAAIGTEEACRGNAAGMLGAEPRRDLAEREKARRGQREQRDLPVEHGKIDMAAGSAGGASLQAGEDRDRHPQSRGQVGDRQPGLHRRTAAFAGEAHDAAHGLEDGVVSLAMGKRSALPEAGAGDVDDASVDGTDGAVIEPVALEGADRKVLQEHVGFAREIADDGLPFGRAQIDRDRLLAAIAGEVIRALAGAATLDERLEAARLVAAVGLLDLDHARAELGQDHARERAGEHARQVENGDVLKRFHRRGLKVSGTRACAG